MQICFCDWLMALKSTYKCTFLLHVHVKLKLPTVYSVVNTQVIQVDHALSEHGKIEIFEFIRSILKITFSISNVLFCTPNSKFGYNLNIFHFGFVCSEKAWYPFRIRCVRDTLGTVLSLVTCNIHVTWTWNFPLDAMLVLTCTSSVRRGFGQTKSSSPPLIRQPVGRPIHGHTRMEADLSVWRTSVKQSV